MLTQDNNNYYCHILSDYKIGTFNVSAGAYLTVSQLSMGLKDFWVIFFFFFFWHLNSELMHTNLLLALHFRMPL